MAKAVDIGWGLGGGWRGYWDNTGIIPAQPQVNYKIKHMSVSY